MNKKNQLLLCVFFMLIMLPQPVYAMHIMEGYLPPIWCLAWGSVSIPFVVFGFFSMKKRVQDNPRVILLIAMSGAYAFVLSALKLPSITGSCSHPTGVGLGAILFGPTVMSLIGLIILLFQAVLLAHGGLTTLGANTFSMAIVGPFVAFFLYRLVKKLNGPLWLAVFLAATLGDLLTYMTTAFQLALAWPDAVGGFQAALIKYMGIFALTQLPIAISEGILTVIIFKAIASYNQEILSGVNIFAKEV